MGNGKSQRRGRQPTATAGARAGRTVGAPQAIPTHAGDGRQVGRAVASAAVGADPARVAGGGVEGGEGAGGGDDHGVANHRRRAGKAPDRHLAAGVGEVAGPIGQLVPQVSPGYGYAAITVAFLGRLNPLGIVTASLLMALLYLGGENAQMNLNLPQAITQLFQGMMLFYLLACDVLILYRPRLKWKWVRRDAKNNTEAMA